MARREYQGGVPTKGMKAPNIAGRSFDDVNLKQQSCKLVERGTGEVMKFAYLSPAEVMRRNPLIESLGFYWQRA